MSESRSDIYKDAGVDLGAGYLAVAKMKSHVERTFIPGVLGGLGSFGAAFQPNISAFQKPVLVSGTDGVGTKLRLAFLMDSHKTVGVDCVAMCVNDILCSGAKPLFFLDYIACGKNSPKKIEDIVCGVADGCVQAGCALIGGETAEMPGFYPADEYDIAGFALGIVDKGKMLDKSKIKCGDLLLALPSSGVHSNGFSLIRHIFGIDKNPLILREFKKELGMPLGDALLEPTKIYAKPILALLEKIDVHGLCHITGGGFYENIPRMLPAQIVAKIDVNAIKTPDIFRLIANTANISVRDMFNTFNMGVGMCAAVCKKDADAAIDILRSFGTDAYVFGELDKGDGGITF